MTLIVLSFIAGVLTVAAPCILPLLPIIIGGSVIEGGKQKPERQWLKPFVIAVSLAGSVIVFTLLIKASTALLGVPQTVWQLLSGGIVTLLGVNFLFPEIWERFAAWSGFFTKSNSLLSQAHKHNGLGGAVLMGAALGPVFSSCSPTYALIVATVLPVSFAEGFVYLTAYAIGMSVTLLLVAYLGQAFVAKLRWLNTSWFQRTIGVLFIVVGVAVIFGLDKDLQAYILDQGWYDPISNLEQRLR